MSAKEEAEEAGRHAQSPQEHTLDPPLTTLHSTHTSYYRNPWEKACDGGRHAKKDKAPRTCAGDPEHGRKEAAAVRPAEDDRAVPSLLPTDRETRLLLRKLKENQERVRSGRRRPAFPPEKGARAGSC